MLPPIKKRTIRSKIKSCFKTYPVPMTAWQVGKIIGRNPASVSSRLCRMRKTKEVICFMDKKKRLLYMLPNLNPIVLNCYSGLPNCDLYYGPEDSKIQQAEVDLMNNS